MKNLPKHFDVYGKKCKVLQTNKPIDLFDPKTEYGHFCKEEFKILICKSGDSRKTATLLHELYHALFYRVGLTQAVDSTLEEVIVETISTFMDENFTMVPKRKS